MKIYKIKFKIFFEPVYVHPFRFLENVKHGLIRWLNWQKIKRKFKELNWSKDDVWELTMFCSSLKEAAHRLCYEITEDRSIYKKIEKKLIYPAYERDWA